MTTSVTAARARARRPVRLRRIDPVLCCIALALVGVVAWTAAPLASGVVAPRTSDQRIEVDVPITTAVTPGWAAGDSSVRLPNLATPGQVRDVTSPGWRLTTNWDNGYEVRVRSTTSPALRGRNAVDGRGVPDDFLDYATSSDCPCPWSDAAYDGGVFAYSVSVASTDAAALDTAKWGSSAARRWRGLSRGSYRAYSTQGGAGTYTMALHFRSMIPDGEVQRAGSYRASVLVSAHPMF